MRLLKKHISLLLILTMMISTFPLTARAEIPVTVSSLDALQEAIENAEDGDTVFIDATITLSSGETIGNTEKKITLQRAENYTVGAMFDVSSEDGAVPIFENIIIDGGMISAQSSAIYVTSDVNFYSVIFQNCSCLNNGGAILIEKGTIRISDCEFRNNLSGNFGGHINIGYDGTVFIEHSSFRNGVANGDGGAIFCSGQLKINDSLISGNHANNGGGISHFSGNAFQISNCEITGNYANNTAGGISTSQIVVNSSKIYGNSARVHADDLSCIGSLSLTSSIEDLINLHKSDGLYPSGWSTDNRDEGKNEKLLSIPFSGESGPFYLKFVFEEEPEPEPEPEPGQENDAEPEPENTEGLEPPINDPEPRNPVHDPSDSYTPMPSRANEEPPKKEKPINLSCGAAIVDNVAAADFCSVVVRFIPKIKPVNRGEMAGIIAGLLTEESRSLPIPDGNAFADIEASPYLDSINFLAAVGLVYGCGDNKYNPDSLLTWAELIVLTARFTEPQDIVLSAIDATGHWAELSIKTVVSAGWLEDKPLDLFATVTYGDLAAFLSEIFQLD